MQKNDCKYSEYLPKPLPQEYYIFKRREVGLMLRKLYYGSKDIIQKPVYGYGKKYNDYGLGFYCTEDINMADYGRGDEKR